MQRLLLTLALLSFSLPGAAQSLDDLATAAQANRRDAAAQNAYGRALRQAGSFRDAERVLRDAARLQNNSLTSLYELARVSFDQNDYRKSRAACRLLERAERNASLTHVCRARAFLVWNRSGRAFEELEAAAALPGAEFETQLALGDAHRLRADIAASETAYRAAIALNPDRHEPHIGLGLLYTAANRPQDAIAALREALTHDSDNPRANLALGRLLGGAEGLRLVERAVVRRPGDATALVTLGEMALAGQDLDKAEESFRAALQLDARRAGALAGLGTALMERGDVDAAEANLQQALELVPSDASIVLALGRLAERRGDTQEAFRNYRYAADLNPGSPEGLLSAARLAIGERRSVLATGFLDRVLQRHRELAPALVLYGDALAARGDTQAALQFYDRALAGQGTVDRAAIETKKRALRASGRRPDGAQRAIAP